MKTLKRAIADVRTGRHTSDTDRPQIGGTAVVTRAPTEAFQAAYRAISGPLVRIEEGGTVRYASAPLPPAESIPAALEEARARLSAARARLEAPVEAVEAWLFLLASLTRAAPKDDPGDERRGIPPNLALTNAVQIMARLLRLPACCFTMDLLEPAAMEASKGPDGTGKPGFWPAFTDLKPFLEPYAAPVREEVRRLAAVVAALEAVMPQQAEGEEPPRVLAAPVPRTPAEEVEDMLAAYEREPATFQRAVKVRGFRSRLRHSHPHLATQFAARLSAMADAQEPEPAPPPPKPRTPSQAARDALVEQAAIEARRRLMAGTSAERGA